jgi:uncharacterized protein (DUF58 family)
MNQSGLLGFFNNERNIILVTSVVFLIVSLLLANTVVFAINFFILSIVLLSFLYTYNYNNNLQSYRKSHSIALTDDEIKIEVGVANYNKLPFYNVVLKDNFAFDIIQEKKIVIQPYLKSGHLNTGYYFGKCGSKKGRYLIGPTKISLKDPFGFYETVKVFDSTQQIKVYPRGFRIKDIPIASRSSQFNVNIKNSSNSGISEEFRGIREYKTGDSLRWVHWPKSLKHRKLIVKDFEMPASKTVNILIDLNKNTFKGLGKYSTLEYMVKTVAAISDYANKNFHKISFAGYGKNYVYVPEGSGNYQLKVINNVLLDLKQDGDMSFDKFLIRHISNIKIDSCVVLIFPTSLIDVEKYLNVISVLQHKYINVISILINDNLFYRVSERNYDNEINFDYAVNKFISAGVTVYSISSLTDLEKGFKLENEKFL